MQNLPPQLLSQRSSLTGTSVFLLQPWEKTTARQEGQDLTMSACAYVMLQWVLWDVGQWLSLG